MIRKVFKVGDTITIHRTSYAGTHNVYALSHLSGGVALIDETISETEDNWGGLVVKSFTFQFLKPGTAAIQFIYYRTPEEAIYEDVFSYVVLAGNADSTFEGAWGEYEPLTEVEKAIFEKAVTLKGVVYIPFIAAKQVVAGYNYRFYCISESVTRDHKFGIARVDIYVPPTGEPRLENIVEY